ncbi:hypothetical protein Bca4012_033844 [Brassica carinata]
MSFSLIYLVLQIFHHMVLISHSFKGSLPDDFKEFFHTTSRKSSDGVFFHIKWILSFSL